MNEFTNSKTRHGTTSGYALHKRRDENSCSSCQKAKSIYDRARRELPPRQLLARASSRAQAYANKRLKAAHLQEYHQYYEEGKQQQKEEV